MNLRKRYLERGQELAEYALIFPFFFLILMGIFDLGRIVYYYSTLTNLAREGARQGIIYAANNPDDTETQVESAISPTICYYAIGLDLGCPNPSINVDLLDDDSNGRNDRIRVQVSYSFSAVTPVMDFFIDLLDSIDDNQFTIRSQSTMRIEY